LIYAALLFLSKKVEKGHKLVDWAGRCVTVPDDAAVPKATAECVGKYEYMPDESWKGTGTCTYTYKGGDTLNDTWQEGSDLKEYTYQNTGGPANSKTPAAVELTRWSNSRTA
jgi:hypothetical protein